MAVTRHEARGNAREPDGGTPGRAKRLSEICSYLSDKSTLAVGRLVLVPKLFLKK